MFDLTHFKTEVGRAEIRARALPLSRAARNLLLVIDASKPAGEWLRLVTGATEADLQTLHQHGLVASQGGFGPGAAPPRAGQGQVAPVGAPVSAPVAAPPPSAAAPAPGPMPAPALTASTGGTPLLDRAALYTYMSGHATKLLGPFKGYAFALEVERCDSLTALQALALQFVERVEKAKGAAAASTVRDALGLR